MKRYALLFVPLVLAACQDTSEPVVDTDALAPTLSIVASQATPERVMPGHVLARFADGIAPADVAGPYGLTVAGTIRGGAVTILRGAVGSERALAARLRGDRRVVYAEPDYLRQTTEIDPRLWAFYNPGGLTVAYSRGRTKGQPILSYASTEDADEDNIEDYAAEGSPVVIGSIDTGVDDRHAELAGRLIGGWDWYDNDNDPSDSDGHGTHTTGTMAGLTVGVAGVSGAAPNVRVYVQRVCGPLGCPTSAIVEAIYAAADYPGMVAMNLSLGGSSLAQSEADAIDYAVHTQGVLVIASAGNGGTGTVSCPACDSNAISVAASNWQDALAYYSNWGSGLDITAPGGELYSNTTDEAGIYSAYAGGGFAYLQGTSMAAPQVTGTAAIVASVTGASGRELRNRILDNTDDLGSPGWDAYFGNGRLNSFRAVTGQTLNEGAPPPPPETLTAAFTYSCSGLDCAFDGSSSTGAVTWDWAFGDGGTASGVTASHSYNDALDYRVTLTVSDISDGHDTATQTVSCALRGKKVRCN